MKPEKLKLIEFAARVRERQTKARKLSDDELIRRVLTEAETWFPRDSNSLILIEELTERFTNLTKKEN